MKTARRLLALVLAVMMVFALVACAGGSDTTDTGNKPNNTNQSAGNNTGGDSGDDPSDKPAFVQKDAPLDEMNGQNFIIIQHEDASNPFGYDVDSKKAEYANARLEEVQNKFGCTFEFSTVAYSTFSTDVQQLAYAEHGGDLVYSSNNAQLRKSLGADPEESLMVDLLKVDNIINFWDMEKWGNITARETMMTGGHFFGVSPALWLDSTPLAFYVIVYSKDKLAEYDVPDLQEYWENEEWDRDVMVDAIVKCYDADETNPVWGMTATLVHMIRSTFLTTGKTVVEIEKINADSTVDWTHGVESGDAIEAFMWLQNTLKNKTKHFNHNSWDYPTWDSEIPFVDGQCAMCLTRPRDIFSDIVTQCENFGLMVWAGVEANTMSGFYENCYSVAIPKFALNAEWSAFLMYDLFEGLGEIETYDDVISYYRETYFDSDIDVEVLLRDGARLQYSYWPNDLDGIWSNLSGGLQSSGSVQMMVGKYSRNLDDKIEQYMIPNQVAIEAYRQNGYFD